MSTNRGPRPRRSSSSTIEPTWATDLGRVEVADVAVAARIPVGVADPLEVHPDRRDPTRVPAPRCLDPQSVGTDPADGAGVQEDGRDSRGRSVDRLAEHAEQRPERLLDADRRLPDPDPVLEQLRALGDRRCREPRSSARPLGGALASQAADLAEDAHRRVVLLRVEDQARPARPRCSRHVDAGGPELGFEGAVVGDAVAIEEQRPLEAGEGHRRHLERSEGGDRLGRQHEPAALEPALGQPVRRRLADRRRAACPGVPRTRAARGAKVRPRTGADHRTRSSIGAPRAMAAAVSSPPRPSPIAATRDTPGTRRQPRGGGRDRIASRPPTRPGSDAVPALSPVPGRSIRRVG